ncbi:MAG: dTDP-4-amino-4,6-dideoxygalactose transaminase [Oscillospiraceae bacterium]|nr:dTDP-4-amino-4,6-dideoxygalactose transaminase [Oscillospiraceae bacterium]
MISFNVPPVVGTELEYIRQALESKKISGDGEFTKRCRKFMQERFNAPHVLLTTSGTSALDMACLLCEFRRGDEVILPSYTFSSTANSVILTGATPVFVDIRPDTMNIDEAKIEAAITDRTRAIMVVHYAGVSCEMDTVMDIARRYGLKVIEDAAQAVMCTYKGRYLGTIGDYGCYSFHETKNYSMGEGGALLVNRDGDLERAEILREKGTNRSKFFRGQIDKYTWVDFGDSYLPSEINAAYLWAQLEKIEEIYDDRMRSYKRYAEAFAPLVEQGVIEVQTIPEKCVHNAHMFYLKLRHLAQRTAFIDHMKSRGISAVFHYVPLHSAPAGLRYGRFNGEDVYTTVESERLVRLPMYYGLTEEDQDEVIRAVTDFFDLRNRYDLSSEADFGKDK